MVGSFQVKVFNGFHPDNANKIFPQAKFSEFPEVAVFFWDQNHTNTYKTNNTDESKIRNKDNEHV